ncbi:MAG: hypothetical protein RLZ97_1303 [Verrucomicrobiota bacterium]|jgi:hypothetical protein
MTDAGYCPRPPPGVKKSVPGLPRGGLDAGNGWEGGRPPYVIA